MINIIIFIMMYLKIIIIVFSLLFISVFIENYLIIPILLIVTLFNYFLIKIISVSKYKNILFHSFWIAYILFFIILEYYEIIGTLNGQNASLTNQLAITIGLPFYFLQIIGACYDVKEKNILMPKIVDFFIYIVYFPKFISGPIEKADFLTKIQNFTFILNESNIISGTNWIVIGLFFKYVIGNHIQSFVYIDNISNPIVIILSALFFELRVYFDFAGYSFMAYGISEIIGLKLTLNFNHPFFQKNIRDFWQNWHISLGKWFHEYLYTPIKNLQIKQLSYTLPFIVFLTSAIWHGTTFNFLLWGSFHALIFVLYIRFFRKFNIPRFVGILSMAFVLIFGRLLFMDSDTESLISKIITIFSFNSWYIDISNISVIIKNIFMPDGKLGMSKTIVLLCIVFIFIFEYINLKQLNSPYKIFHNKYIILIFFVLTIFLGISNVTVGFIYGRQ